MDAITPQAQQTKVWFLPALAEAISGWFPELEGRSLAVSEVSITKENVPTLPLVMSAFIRSAAEPPTRSPSHVMDVVDTFIVEFWLEPARYKKANGAETPFWSYYPYEDIRDTLLTNLAYWTTPNGERISFRGLQMGADPLAVTLTFTFFAVFRWCPSTMPATGEPYSMGICLHPPRECCEPDCEEPDPCP
jgi:hypothetical protein